MAQIRAALTELEKGNGFAFATGKEARKEERALAREFKSQLKMSSSGIVTGPGAAAAVKVDDKYAHMAAAAPSATVGAADAAWDD